MAKPRVFVSSTYYDLKHIRSSLENFIDSLGFESILSEKGQIAYSPDIPLDESCYREVGNADIFIIIIGGRYGSEKSGSDEKTEKQFFDRYDSITKQEYKSAVDRDVPTYILIDKSVYSEYKLFQMNKNNESINYPQVDSSNIYHLIDDILSQPKNNPVHQFDRYSDIEAWLKEQWAGLFREFLNQRSKQTQIATLSSQVSTLAEINETLRKYLEVIMSKISPEESKELISNESIRLENIKLDKEIEKTLLYSFVRPYGILIEDLKNALITSESIVEFFENIGGKADSGFEQQFLDDLKDWIVDISETRKILGLKPY